jgi:hypothetical protein
MPEASKEPSLEVPALILLLLVKVLQMLLGVEVTWLKGRRIQLFD